jgi:UDP-GlcNAc3NAcA epimerase
MKTNQSKISCIESNNSIFVHQSMTKQKYILTVVGARPQFIKAAAISRCLRKNFSDIREELIHTGQHFDNAMSQVFFDELGIPAPKVHLSHQANHALSVGQMIDELHTVFTREKPDGILVYGDTNSTFAAAVAANMLHIPLFHIEAGLRSFNKSMPEELNRIYTDQVATLLFCPTQTALHNLEAEGFDTNVRAPFFQDKPGVFMTGDIMLDNLSHFSQHLRGSYLEQLQIQQDRFVLLTLHRPQNADNVSRLNAILSGLMEVCSTLDLNLVFPVHPRTLKTLQTLPELFNLLKDHPRVRIIDPLPYLAVLELTKNARFVATDSGGLQKEAHFMNKPVVVLRKETEWTEIIDDNNGVLVDADPIKIKNIPHWLQNEASNSYIPHFGNGKAAVETCTIIHDFLFSSL